MQSNPAVGSGRVLKLPYPRIEEKHRPGGDFASGRGKSLEHSEIPDSQAGSITHYGPAYAVRSVENIFPVPRSNGIIIDQLLYDWVNPVASFENDQRPSVPT